MKKLLLLTITAGLAVSSYAQNAIGTKKAFTGTTVNDFTTAAPAAYKTTATIIHDTLLLTNLGPTDTDIYVYPTNVGDGTDSGFIFGNGILGFDGFAERYDFSGTDSTVQVLGMLTIFVGQYNPTTANNVRFKVWSPDAPLVLTPTLSFSGIPGTVLDSIDVSYKNLRIDNTGATDTIKTVWFASPTAYLSTSFFVGATMSYNWAAMNGDTITVLVSGQRLNPSLTITSGDTVVNNQNMIHNSTTGLWYDNAFNFGVDAEYYFFPIINSKITVGVKGISNKNFTFFGTYPNPAVSNTNVKFAVANTTNVTIQVMDMNGRVISTVNENNMAAGEHTVNIETANLAAGDYLVFVRTTEGGGIASKISIVK